MKDFTDGPAPGFIQLWWSQGGAFPVLLAMILLVLTVLSYAGLRDGLVFETRGIEVIGQVSERREVEVRRDGKTATVHYVTIRYEVGDDVIEVEREVPRSFFRESPPYRYKKIRYLRDDPKAVEFTVGETWFEGQKLRWLTLLVGLGALIYFWRTARPVVEALRARRYGTVKWARVLQVERRQDGDTLKYVLVFSTKDRIVGESLPSSKDDRYRAYPKGTEIEVYQGSRRRLWWVGDVGPYGSASRVPSVSRR